ncbi:MAG: RidA family protein [Gammaproteobacteria bacterium]|jgi:2-iminobutanoate/2-iminopropanoate deaminase|nr:RidA family protein [Gammaproteobacteria bacterium]
MSIKRVNVDGLMKLDAFSHAVVAGDFIYVSGSLGTMGETIDLAPGGTAGETTQVLKNIETILAGCGASLKDVVKMGVFLSDMETFPEMNSAYVEIMGDTPPARITVGKAGLAIGAAVEIDCVAYKPSA